MANLLPLVNWGNGIIMISIFGVVCVALVAALLIFMNSGNKDKS